MIGRLETLTRTVLLVAVCFDPALGQEPPPAILEIDVENTVQYIQDISDVSRFGTDPNPTTAVAGRNFRPFLVLGDIVAVNGQPATGTVSFNARQVMLAASPTPGQGIADIVRGNANEQTFEIQTVDGAPIGSIMASGLGAGTAPPGAPMGTAQGNNAIFGGTGAFLGARGQAGRAVTAQDIADRQASMSEDPANRRKNGGGRERFVLHVIPMARPEIVTTSSGLALFHADFSPVTSAKPAKPGEIVILKATGLGPTRPGVDPGQRFPLDALQEVNSPVNVTVNGRAADVINKMGWPGLADTYRVDFRLPDGIASGIAVIQLSAAWIPASPVNISIQ